MPEHMDNPAPPAPRRAGLVQYALGAAGAVGAAILFFSGSWLIGAGVAALSLLFIRAGGRAKREAAFQMQMGEADYRFQPPPEQAPQQGMGRGQAMALDSSPGDMERAQQAARRVPPPQNIAAVETGHPVPTTRGTPALASGPVK